MSVLHAYNVSSNKGILLSGTFMYYNILLTALYKEVSKFDFFWNKAQCVAIKIRAIERYHSQRRSRC